MKLIYMLIWLSPITLVPPATADDSSGTVILQDDFNRDEKEPMKEQIGNGWGTNSQSRAKGGTKQVDLVDGAMHITRAAVADHGVSVTHEVAFRDTTIRLRFKLGAKDDLGINIADMKEKSVHAGHICVAKIRLGRVEIVDLKTGRMNLVTRERRLVGKLTAEDEALIKSKQKSFKAGLAADEWHQLEVGITGDVMSVAIDGKKIGVFQSEGIAHATKSRLRLAVNKTAWVDDVKVIRHK